MEQEGIVLEVIRRKTVGRTVGQRKVHPTILQAVIRAIATKTSLLNAYLIVTGNSAGMTAATANVGNVNAVTIFAKVAGVSAFLCAQESSAVLTCAELTVDRARRAEYATMNVVSVFAELILAEENAVRVLLANVAMSDIALVCQIAQTKTAGMTDAGEAVELVRPDTSANLPVASAKKIHACIVRMVSALTDNALLANGHAILQSDTR